MRYEALPTHPAALEPRELLQQCRMERGRGSGPGGQHRNKVETAVTLTHEPTGLTGQAGERRESEANRKKALFRLRLELARRMRVPWPDRRSPSRLWMQRRTAAGRLSINPGHDDYPALLAEALDCIAGFEADVPAAAQALGVSTSQLVKLLAHDPLALEAVNDHRKELGLHRMRP